MGFKSWVKRTLTKRKPPLFREISSSGLRAGGGVSLFDYGESGTMAVSAVYRCVNILADSIASLPLYHQKLRGGIFVTDEASRLNYLLNVQPNDMMSAFDFWRRAIQELLLDGNIYIVPIYEPTSEGIARLILCNRGTVSYNYGDGRYYVNDIQNGISGQYRECDIIHIKGMTTSDRNRGVGVITFARKTINIAAAGDEETRRRFDNGGVVKGIVSNGTSTRGFGEYQDEQLKMTAENLDDRFQQGERIVELPGQVDFRQLSMSSADMQFLESRKFTVREICRFFGVHPSFVFDDTSNNYKSAEQANVAFLTHTLNPILCNIENELLRKLVGTKTSHKNRFRFNRRGLYASDLDGEMRYRSNLLQTGTTVNEIRRMEDLPPVEGGDVVMVSANLKTITELTNNTITQSNNETERDSEDTPDE